MTGAIGATATYLAFARSPGTWRPWVTLTLATTVSTFTSIYRVRAAKHFPTDVLAGTFAGAGIGIVVPHCIAPKTCNNVASGLVSRPKSMAAAKRAGGSLTMSGVF
jgi:undecaprenyl-diphosphatase